jgi:hypothetical protein
MSHGTDALYGFAAHDPRRTQPRAIAPAPRAFSPNIVAHVALAFVATTCLWTVYSHIGASGNEAATLAERFAALPMHDTVARPAPAAIKERAAAVQQRYSGLLDARQIGSAPAVLSKGKVASLAEHLVALTVPNAIKSQDRFPQSAGDAKQAARAVPLPAPRPTQLASLQAGPEASTPAPFKPKAMVEDKATVLALISSNKNSLFNRLFGRQKQEGPALAYASTDGGISGDTQTILFDGMPKYDQYTAVYDIAARTVYLPDGTELEAHSGLGKRMDDAWNVHIKMHGATPPHVYNLTMREALFHGVEAIRMTPIGGPDRIFGRTGILAHTYMLGPRGDSNGCVSFKNYSAFLQAFKRGHVKRMVVVAKLA